MSKSREKTGIPTKTLFFFGLFLSLLGWGMAWLQYNKIYNSEKVKHKKQADAVTMLRYKHDLFHAYSGKPEQIKFYSHVRKTSEELQKITKEQNIGRLGYALNNLVKLAHDVSYNSYYDKSKNSKELFAEHLSVALAFSEFQENQPSQFDRSKLENDINFFLLVEDVKGKDHLKRETVLEYLGTFLGSSAYWLTSAERLKTATQLMQSDWMFSAMILDDRFRPELILMAKGEYRTEPASLKMPAWPNFWPVGYKLIILIAVVQSCIFLLSLLIYYICGNWTIGSRVNYTANEKYGSFFTPNWRNPLVWFVILAAYTVPAITGLAGWLVYRIGSWLFKVRAANVARSARSKKSLNPDAILQQGKDQLATLGKLIK